MAKLSSVFNDTQFDNSGNLLNGGFIYSYSAGSVTPLATYTTSSGGVAQANPITLNSRGETASPIWLTEGLLYKLRLFDASNNFIREFDNIAGVGDNSITVDQWIVSGITPTYVNATQFTLPGDQTSAFQVSRRVKATVTAGTVYGTISASVFAALTTVTLVMDTGQVLDSGLSSVSYGILTPQNPSSPPLSSFPIDTLIATDYLAFTDVSDSNKNKRGLVSDIVALVPLAYNANINGLILSTAGASTTLTVSARNAWDSTKTSLMTLLVNTAKTTASWAVGTATGGKSQTGAVAINTWYHFYEIVRPDTGVVDICFSTNPESTGLVAADFVAGGGNVANAYTKWRYIGSALTNASSQWTKFFQDGDDFNWDVMPTLNVNTTNPGTAAVTATLSTPLGQRVKANITAQLQSIGGAGSTLLVTDLSQTDTAPSQTAAPIGQVTSTPSTAINLVTSSPITVNTNTSSQVRYRVDTSNANVIVRIGTTGYTNPRGKNL